MAKTATVVADPEAGTAGPDMEVVEGTTWEEREGRVIKEIVRNSMRFEWRDPRSLQPNDNNPKDHPSLQRSAMTDFFDDVGWAGALLYNEQTGHLLDGHMRQADALERNEDVVPTLIINVDQAKENRILAFLDKIGSLFAERKDTTKKLLEGQNVPDSLLALLNVGTTADLLLGSGDDEAAPKPFPEGGLSLVLGEAYNYVVLLFKTELDWLAAQDHFGLKRVRCAFSTSIGQGRVVDGSKYLDSIYGDEMPAIREKTAAEMLLGKPTAVTGEILTKVREEARRLEVGEEETRDDE